MFDDIRKLLGLETKAAGPVSLTASSPELLALFGAAPTAAGAVVTPETALRVPAVACATRAIGEAVACLPRSVYRVAADGSRVPVPDHPAQALLSGEWNDWTGAYDGFLGATIDALTNDAGALVWVNRVNGAPRELIRYRPGTFSVTRDAATGEPAFKLNTADGPRELAAGDCIAVTAFGAVGRAPLTLAREAIGLALVMERHAGKLFAAGARPGGVLKYGKTLGEAALKRLKDSFQAVYSGTDKSGNTLILEDGMEFMPLTFSSVDLQFLELRRYQVLEIARAFRVPPHMLFELERATWGNVESLGREFLVFCLQPMLRAWESALRRALLTPDERKSGLVIEFDEDDLTQANIADRATAYSQLIAARVINPNTARTWERLAPYPGGEVYANPAITPGAAATPGATS
ncbi:phage portal protein [Blastochloris tepida]|uniref:Head HK97 family portal protein n=1 Tax=Blastochloris tepida TaxID=2233851 RepID=A0A348FXU0_9HYPH|nr:phage portal protein [Blastochloris tepida]BBF92123.1 head HK97 family portal protein [Blastochloris tepida]